MVSFYIVAATVAAIILRTLQIARRGALPNRQRAAELNLRIFRYLNYRTDRPAAHKLKGYTMTDREKEKALLPEWEFENSVIEIYLNKSYYRNITRYAMGYKLLWWHFRPTEAQIWKYRERNVGRNQIAEGMKIMYTAYLHRDIWYTDSQGIEKPREVSDYNQHRLKALLPSEIWEGLGRLKMGQEGVTEQWEYMHHTDQAEALPTLEEMEGYDPAFEVGNDYLRELEKTYSLPANETNTIELPTKISPYRPRLDAERETNTHPAPLQEIPVMEIEL